MNSLSSRVAPVMVPPVTSAWLTVAVTLVKAVTSLIALALPIADEDFRVVENASSVDSVARIETPLSATSPSANAAEVTATPSLRD